MKLNERQSTSDITASQFCLNSIIVFDFGIVMFRLAV